MTDRVIDNPILNRSYDEPARHVAFDVDGITDEIVADRRPSAAFSPVSTSSTQWVKDAARGALKGQGFDLLRGVDVDNLTTGKIRSNPADEVARWMIDNDHDSDSFFVRMCYVCGSGTDTHQGLKRGLRAEIDEDASASVYATESRPFPKPGSGRIAVKVINHYGDEVLKVFEVA